MGSKNYQCIQGFEDEWRMFPGNSSSPRQAARIIDKKSSHNERNDEDLRRDSRLQGCIIRGKWEIVMGRLKDYKRENGNCNVPSHHDKLGRWVQKQRTKFRTVELSSSQIESLRSIDFEFERQEHSKPRNPVSGELIDANFYNILKRVVEYIEKRGHG